MKQETKDSLQIIMWVCLLFLCISFFFLINLRIKGEADCSVTGISFEGNTTSAFQNLSMTNGSLSCKFKGDFPVIFFLGK